MALILPNFEDLNIVVVGDIMRDRYWFGDTSRISPEAPVPVVHVRISEDRPGGAANVAINLSALGCKVKLLGVVGADEAADNLEKQLQEANIACFLSRIENRPTITKLRVLGRNQQLIRLDFEEGFDDINFQSLLAQYQKIIQDADAIILSDYGKGMLKHPQEFIRIANLAGIPITVDPKSNDFSKYRGAMLITPNLKEFEAATGGKCYEEAEIVNKGQSLISECQLKALLITRGEEGMTLLEKNEEPLYLRAHTTEVYDVSGAGDTVISVLTALLASGYELKNAAKVANIAAGIVVKKLGVACVSAAELRRALQRYLGSEFGILQEEELILTIADARAHGEKIVMTNGCFDLLHCGHITYLEEAKSLGDRLIVAVNTDESVALLKGESRPINELKDRMRMIAAIRAIDWVVSFSEPTPERLISRILPDILVKGGDYQISDIAGAKQVIANGGQVKIINFVPGYSSTSMVEKIKFMTP